MQLSKFHSELSIGRMEKVYEIHRNFGGSNSKEVKYHFAGGKKQDQEILYSEVCASTRNTKNKFA